MKFEIEVSELQQIIKNLSTPDQLFQTLRHEIKGKVGDWLSDLMKAELSVVLGRDKHQRTQEGKEKNYRNGYYKRRFTLKNVGEVTAEVPRDRNNDYQTKVAPRFQRYETAIKEELSLLFLSGVSTRNLSMLSKKLIGRPISASEISQCNKELVGAVEKWRVRDLSQESVKYLFIDGVNFRMRVKGSVELVPVLAVIGVLESNHKLVLALQSGDKESASCWREVFRDLKSRGMGADKIQLGIMDGLRGLETVFKEEFRKAKVQRCQFHVSGNVLTKVPRKNKQEVADHLRNIFYSSSKKKALGYFKEFEDKYKEVYPSAYKSLANSLESCLTYLKFPKEEWISLRTTNCIERLNKEFKRRTAPMEIVAGESSCYCLLAFISFKMEMHWKTAPIGKSNVHNLTFMQKIKDL